MIRLLVPLLLIAVPLIEIALFVVVGGRIGVAATVAVVVATAVAGTFMLRLQGLAVLRDAQRALDSGQIPIAPVIDGIGLLAAGLLLLTPGFLTDAIGFLLFVPQLRRWLATAVWRKLARSGSIAVHAGVARGEYRGRGPSRSGPVIDADYSEIDEDDRAAADARETPDAGSPWRGPDGGRP